MKIFFMFLGKHFVSNLKGKIHFFITIGNKKSFIVNYHVKNYKIFNKRRLL